jgi:hypothetical protein
MRPALILGITLLLTCQYPVDFSDLPETQKFLVIEADVTEDYVRVDVRYSLERVTSAGAYTLPPPPQASAFIHSGNGQIYQVSNTRGVLDTLFKGRVGQSYKLVVHTEGKTFESTEETMRPCPALDTLVVQYTRESFRDKADLLYDGYDIYARASDIAGVENFYQWHWIHYSKAVQCNKIFDRAQNTEAYVPCFPHNCWNIVQNQRVIVQKDNLRDGQALIQAVVRVPYATPPNRYYLRVEQRSITPTVFDHLKSLETQTETVGTLFDVPAQTRFSPNILNTTDRSEKILGVFNVYSYRYKIVVIDMKKEIAGAVVKTVVDPTPYHSNALLSAPCTEETYRTQKRPEGWVD